MSTLSERHVPRLAAVMREGERVTPLELFFDLVFVLVLVVLVPVTDALGISSLATLAILAGALGALILYEALRFAEMRDRVRHRAAPGGAPNR
ncbi:MAG TPA: hypothetical protein VFV03_06205 [Solirubrobacteraceae bacterium]|nr:hypothetical protein [Solirubrobacteraceae bacterium]